MKGVLTGMVIFCFLLAPLAGRSQLADSRWIIVLRDKQSTPYRLDNPAAYLSGAAIQRRVRQQIPIDSSDLPIDPAYLDSISAVPNVSILNVSKWMNQVLIKTTDPNALAAINAFSFTLKTAVIAARVIPGAGRSTRNKMAPDGIQSAGKNVGLLHKRESGSGGNLLNYGYSYDQIHIHKGEWLHNQGFTGAGLTIAILDDGFYGWLSNPAFDSVRWNNQVLGTYDYVNQKTSVNEEDAHGMHCFSILAANVPGIMVGSAPKARYWLLKTEDVHSEYPVEEQNWAAAAEFADSAGADMISTSLGYVHFDDSTLDHPYAERDGHSTLITKAANYAVSKGMIVTASAGNTGNAADDSKYVVCPADGDSVLAVGAVDAGGVIGSFSCQGPNAAGRLKPDVVSVGAGTIIAETDGSAGRGNGTSYSNPNMAGLVACLWQAFPACSSRQIMDAVRKSSDRYAHPDAHYGNGIPDFREAYALLALQRTLNHYFSDPSAPWLRVSPVPFGSQFTVYFKAPHNGQANIALIDAGGRVLETISMSVIAGRLYSAGFPGTPQLARGVYFIRYADGQSARSVAVLKNQSGR